VEEVYEAAKDLAAGGASDQEIADGIHKIFSTKVPPEALKHILNYGARLPGIGP
jgi:hypothetical protein